MGGPNAMAHFMHASVRDGSGRRMMPAISSTTIAQSRVRIERDLLVQFGQIGMRIV